MSDTVVLFGATSYVGSGVVRALTDAGYRVRAPVRRPAIARILLEDYADCLEIVPLDSAGRDLRGGVAAVVNLAYARGAWPHQLYGQTRRLMQHVLDAAHETNASRLIHISTLAVFGYQLERRPEPVPVPWRAADAYIESKLYAEQLLLEQRAALHALSIVRLGNVIGPAAPLWCAGIAQQLLEGRPLAYQGELGFLNATYLDNVGAYVAELVHRPPEELRAFGAIHHLAEFADHPWQEALDCFAEAVGRRYVLAERQSGHGRRIGLGVARDVLMQANRGPIGSYARALAGRVGPTRVLDAVILRLRDLKYAPRLAGDGLRPDDEFVAQVLSTQVRFESHTVRGWRPAVSFEKACRTMAEWLRHAGYALEDSADELLIGA